MLPLNFDYSLLFPSLLHWWFVYARLILNWNEFTQFQIISVFRHLSTMSQLLMMEMNAQPEPAIGPILDRHFTNQIMERIVDWAIEAPQFLTPTCQVIASRKRQFPFVLICRIISLEGCFRYPSVLSTVCVGVFDMIIQFLCMLPAYSLKYNILWWTSSSILSGNFFFGTSISISLICVWSH